LATTRQLEGSLRFKFEEVERNLNMKFNATAGEFARLHEKVDFLLFTLQASERPTSTSGGLPPVLTWCVAIPISQCDEFLAPRRGCELEREVSRMLCPRTCRTSLRNAAMRRCRRHGLAKQSHTRLIGKSSFCWVPRQPRRSLGRSSALT
jgi:hypothetical protein